MKKFYSIALVIALAMSGLVMTSCSDKSKEDKSKKTKVTVDEEDIDSADALVYEIGSTITMGNYDGEDISWIVLDEKDGQYLIIYEKALENKPYNDELAYVTWEECTLRVWLNNDFYSDVFSAEEQSKIMTTTVEPGDNPEYDTDAGNSTHDKVFLLSAGEVNQYFDGENAGIFNDKNGAAHTWWLRSPGVKQDLAVVFDCWGKINYMGNYADSPFIAVRPAMWITP